MKAVKRRRRKRAVPGLRLKINLLLLAIQVPALVILTFETSRGIQDLFQDMWRSEAEQLAEDLNEDLTTYFAMKENERQAVEVAKDFNEGLTGTLHGLYFREIQPPKMPENPYKLVLDDFFSSTSAPGLNFNASVFVAQGAQLKCRASAGDRAPTEPDEYDSYAFEGNIKKRIIEEPDYHATVIHRAFRGPGGSRIGAIRLSLDQTANTLRIQHLSRQRFVGMVVVFALGVAVLFTGMHFLVVYPVGKLAKAMARAREGRLEVVAVGPSKDEIGLLGRNYNTMVLKLRALLDDKEKLLEEVRDLNIHLQDRIDEAVHDLAKSHREIQKAYQDLYSSQRELQRLERLASLGQVAREIAHEFSTPLNVIYGTLQMLLEDPDLKAEHRERLGRLLNQTDRLIQISRDTLSPLKMPPPELHPARLNDLVGEIGAFMSPAFEARGVEFDAKLGKDLPPIRADLHQLEQVLLNLISNAMDALPVGGKIEVETTLDDSGTPPFVVLQVRDDGMGISSEHLPHIFDPFFTTKGAGRGTGLGLSICREIVDQHQGKITIESEPGKGTTITVRLPAVEEEDTSGEAAA